MSNELEEVNAAIKELIEAERIEARDDGYDNGYDDGYESGYDKGFKEGKAEALEGTDE